MRNFLLVLIILPLAAFVQVLHAQNTPASKIKVVYHNIPVCVVSGIRIDGDHKKFEVVYAVGNVEHHIYLAGQVYAKRFWQKPDFYLQRVEAMESSGASLGVTTVSRAPLIQ